MVTLSEMIILRYLLLHDYHMMWDHFSDGGKNKWWGTKELARTIKTFEYENTKQRQM